MAASLELPYSPPTTKSVSAWARRAHASAPRIEATRDARELYELRVATAPLADAGTHAHVAICLWGEGGVSGDVLLHSRLGESPFSEPQGVAAFR